MSAKLCTHLETITIEMYFEIHFVEINKLIVNQSCEHSLKCNRVLFQQYVGVPANKS